MATTASSMTTVVSTEGQVILPKSVRDQRHWPAGTRLTIEDTPEGVILKPAPIFPPTRVEDVAGCLAKYYDGPPLTLEDMDAAVMAEARRRARD